jgi:hypothetical protein
MSKWCRRQCGRARPPSSSYNQATTAVTSAAESWNRNQPTRLPRRCWFRPFDFVTT